MLFVVVAGALLSATLLATCRGWCAIDLPRNTMSPPSGPLRGLRVVEFAGLGPGPFACMLLADMGAEVVRIARPGTGATDSLDTIGRGRTTVELDLKDSRHIQQVLNLLAHADALVEGFRPGVMERLGLGPAEVAARNARLVYGRMTGWGQDGPLAHAAGHDINYISITGTLAAIGEAGREPVPPLNLVGDYGGGSLYLGWDCLPPSWKLGRRDAGKWSMPPSATERFRS